MRYVDYLAMLPESVCPFCSSEDHIFLENDAAFLTYAKAPYHPHHLLVVPHKHHTSLLALSEEEARGLWELIRQGISILRSLGYVDYSVLVREGNVGKSVPHLHYHLIPNHHIGDLDANANERNILTEEESEQLYGEVMHAIANRK